MTGGPPDRPASARTGAEGGEPACLLPLLCPACGRVPDGPPGPTCASCGAALDAADDSPGSS